MSEFVEKLNDSSHFLSACSTSLNDACPEIWYTERCKQVSAPVQRELPSVQNLNYMLLVGCSVFPRDDLQYTVVCKCMGQSSVNQVGGSEVAISSSSGVSTVSVHVRI